VRGLDVRRDAARRASCRLVAAQEEAGRGGWVSERKTEEEANLLQQRERQICHKFCKYTTARLHRVSNVRPDLDPLSTGPLYSIAEYE
jgi:hypothetical protein